MLVLRVPGRRALILHTSDGPIRVINVGRNARRIGIAAPDHVRVTREPLHPDELRLRLGNMEEQKNYHKERKEHYAERETFYRSKCEELDRRLSVIEDLEA